MKKREIFIIAFGCLIGILYLALVFAADYYILGEYFIMDINEWGTCKTVNNANSISYFVPTRTPIEWNSFINNPPVGVSTTLDCGGGGPCDYRVCENTWAPTCTALIRCDLFTNDCCYEGMPDPGDDCPVECMDIM